MTMRLFLVAAGLTGFVLAGPWQPPVISAELASTLLGVQTDFCLMPADRTPAAYRQTRGGGAGRELAGDDRRTGDWPPRGAAGGDIMPTRTVFDPYPTFDAVSVDPQAGKVFFTDSSLSSVRGYAVTAGGDAPGVTDYENLILGPDTGIGFIAGGEADPERKEFYAVNNDGGGVVVFGYEQTGAVRPVRQIGRAHV